MFEKVPTPPALPPENTRKAEVVFRLVSRASHDSIASIVLCPEKYSPYVSLDTAVREPDHIEPSQYFAQTMFHLGIHA